MISKEHECFTRQFEIGLTRQPAFVEYMQCYGSSSIPSDTEPDYEPDDSYGPVEALGAPLPHGVDNYLSWSTLIVEVGYSRRWGNGRGYLDWKARQWSRFPGVRFILCVAVTDRLATAEYKLHTVERNDRNQVRRLRHQNPVPVVGPTVVEYNSRGLLGLPPGANIAPIAGEHFPEPTIDVDLFQVLELARRNFPPLQPLKHAMRRRVGV